MNIFDLSVFFVSLILLLLSILIYFIFLKPEKLDFGYFSWIFYLYFVFGILGSYFIFFGWVDNLYFVEPFNNLQGLKTEVLFFMNFGLFSITFTFFVLSFFSKESYKNSSLRYIGKCCKKDSTLVELYLLSTFLFSSVYYLMSIWPAPLFMAFNGASVLDIAVRRNEVTEGFKGFGIIKTISIFSANIVFVYSLINIFIFKRKLFLIYFLISVFVVLASIEKAPLLFCIFAFVTSIFYMGIKLDLKLIFGTLLCILLLLFSMYFLFFQSSDLEVILNLIIERIFLAQMISVYLSISFYDENLIYFSSMNNIFAKLFNNEISQRSSEYLMEVFYPGMREGGSWNVNGIFLHEAYSNFGYFGIIISSFYFALLNFIFYKIFIRINKSVISVCLFSYFTVNQIAMLTSFNMMVFNSFLFLIIFVYILPIEIFYKFRKNIKINKGSEQ